MHFYVDIVSTFRAGEVKSLTDSKKKIVIIFFSVPVFGIDQWIEIKVIFFIGALKFFSSKFMRNAGIWDYNQDGIEKKILIYIKNIFNLFVGIEPVKIFYSMNFTSKLLKNIWQFSNLKFIETFSFTTDWLKYWQQVTAVKP